MFDRILLLTTHRCNSNNDIRKHGLAPRMTFSETYKYFIFIIIQLP